MHHGLARSPAWFVVFVSCAASTAAAQSGAVKGRVIDSTGQGVSGAVVSIDRTELRTTAGSDGSYVLRAIAAGTRTLRARAIGYRPAVAQVTIEAGRTIERDLVVTKSPVQLAPVEVVVGSRARHTAADELAVPVDIVPAQVITKQG